MGARVMPCLKTLLANVDAEAWTNPHTYQMVKRYMRPPEELYNSVKDPYNDQPRQHRTQSS